MAEAAASTNSTVIPLRNPPKRKVRAAVFPKPVKKKAGNVDDSSGESAVDPFAELERQGKLITPPFELLVLASLYEDSSELGQVLEAMETNVVGYGWSLALTAATKAKLDNLEELDEELAEVVEEEWETFDEFINYGNWDDDSFTFMRRQQRRDYESTGMSYMEVVVNKAGMPIGFRHCPSHRMRISVADPQPTLISEQRIIGRGNRRRIVTRTKMRRLRRYAQVSADRQAVVWFKEFGDPRRISRETGEVMKPGDTGPEANPIIYRHIYAPRTPYGIPRYMGALLSILGTRAAEEVNYSTFRNNQIPSMMLLVSNGQLTEETIERITDFAENVIQGDDNRSRFLIVEAEPEPVVGEVGGGQVKIEVKNMTDIQHNDALFVDYEKSNAHKVRQSWRLPPIILGAGEEYTRTVAETSRRLAEEQVFDPERREEDWHWNRLLHAMGCVYHEFKTNTPNVTNDDDLVKILTAGEKTGAVTPRIANEIMSDILGRPLPQVDESKVPLDVPYSLTMAERVKNQAQPNEVGQQVTALKGLTEIHREVMKAFVAKEKSLAKGKFPGLVLDTLKAEELLSGVTSKLVLPVEADTDGRLLALCDDTHLLGWVELSVAKAEEGSWAYEVVTVESATPRRHAGVSGGPFVDTVSTTVSV